MKEDLPTVEMKIVDIIERWPKAQIVLVKHGLDVCCGGVHPLAMAAKAHGLDADAVLAELIAAVRAP